MSDQDKSQNIYNKLRDLRRARGLTVDSLAKKMGEDSQRVGRIERGRRSLTIDYLLKAAKALETPIETFLEKSEEKEAPSSSKSSSDVEILNDVIVFVEEYLELAQKVLNPQQKAKVVSKTYELVSKFPKAEQVPFLQALKEFHSCWTNL